MQNSTKASESGLQAILCFGSFGKFHKGHEDFLRQCSAIAKKLLVGVFDTSQDGTSPQSRTRTIEMFLRKNKIAFETVILEHNQLNNLIERDDLSFLAFSQLNKSVAEKFNSERIANGKSSLILVEIPLTVAFDGNPLVTERILRGEIALNGSKALQKEIIRKVSKIRDNIVEIFLEENEPLYGYQINKKYTRKYGRLSLRLTYYHLSKGVSEGVFKLVERKKHEGGFSWGGVSERSYYELAKSPANPESTPSYSNG